MTSRYRYVALGHIHKGYSVDRGRVWYSGTPVAVNFAEGASARKVLLVDLEEGALRNVQPIVVPATRRVVELRGDEASLRAALATLAGDEPEPALVSMILESPEPVLGQRDAIQAHLDSLFPDRSRRPVIAAWARDPHDGWRANAPAAASDGATDPRDGLPTGLD